MKLTATRDPAESKTVYVVELEDIDLITMDLDPIDRAIVSFASRPNAPASVVLTALGGIARQLDRDALRRLRAERRRKLRQGLDS